MLHLHPLTLEDILQKERREKLELFQRLGYYFISFRAVGTRSRSSNDDDNDSNYKGQSGSPGHEDDKKLGRGFGLGLDAGGGLLEANIYLVVFREGIVSFHFHDVTEHIDRVRSRILLLSNVLANTSADWIAHGILDSVIDSFFPLLGKIEREVMEIEDVVLVDEAFRRMKRELAMSVGPALGGEAGGSGTLVHGEGGGSPEEKGDIWNEKELFPASMRHERRMKRRFSLLRSKTYPTFRLHVPTFRLRLPSATFFRRFASPRTYIIRLRRIWIHLRTAPFPPRLRLRHRLRKLWLHLRIAFRSVLYTLGLSRFIPSSSRSTLYTTATADSGSRFGSRGYGYGAYPNLLSDEDMMLLMMDMDSDRGVSPRYALLIRMARTRKLVTALTRLLASKNEVVTAIRKRLIGSGSVKEGKMEENAEVAMYLGDVQGVFFWCLLVRRVNC